MLGKSRVRYRMHKLQGLCQPAFLSMRFCSPELIFSCSGKALGSLGLLLCCLRPCIMFSWTFNVDGDLSLQLLGSHHALGVSVPPCLAPSCLQDPPYFQGELVKTGWWAHQKSHFLPLSVFSRGGILGLVKRWFPATLCSC